LASFCAFGSFSAFKSLSVVPTAAFVMMEGKSLQIPKIRNKDPHHPQAKTPKVEIAMMIGEKLCTNFLSKDC